MDSTFVGSVASLAEIRAAKVGDSAKNREHESRQKNNTVVNIVLQKKKEYPWVLSILGHIEVKWTHLS